MPSFETQADIFTRLSVFDSPKDSSNTFKTHKNISLYFKRRYLIIYKYLNYGKIKGTNLHIFSRVVTYGSLPGSLQSFKKTLQNHFKKSPGEGMVYNEHSRLGAVKQCWLKNLVSMLYCRC